ncbi:hypothetical protein J1N35_033277 [Gossypium stocksii]|uniref:Reverse transcriptase n=1 Tax=Gossypium stocksii TaxID=47602 RepID=A0A9D3UPW2_9ROSI|nr:hypothetical protein J1N35_033277 [Gossypium stocksii]
MAFQLCFTKTADTSLGMTLPDFIYKLLTKRMGQKGFMAVKLDMSKAYDRVEWDFIKKVMV